LVWKSELTLSCQLSCSPLPTSSVSFASLGRMTESLPPRPLYLFAPWTIASFLSSARLLKSTVSAPVVKSVPAFTVKEAAAVTLFFSFDSATAWPSSAYR
jgi:hypothetical protein